MQVSSGPPASVAQQQSTWLLTRVGVGASPTGGTRSHSGCSAACAARLVWNEEVGGSNPPARTISYLQGGVAVARETLTLEAGVRFPAPQPHASVVQLERRLTSNQDDAGSNPAGRTIPGSANGKLRGFEPRDPGSTPGPGATASPSGKAPTCKVGMRRFDSDRGLQTPSSNGQDARLSIWRCGFESRRGHQLSAEW